MSTAGIKVRFVFVCISTITYWVYQSLLSGGQDWALDQGS